MSDTENSKRVTRRDFIAISSGIAAAAALSGVPQLAQAKIKKPRLPSNVKPNILFIFTDQERFFNQMPSKFPLPGHNRLANTGTSFVQHQVSATMCTSSRSVMLTGLQTNMTRMFDNCDVPYIQDMSTSIPTLGHMLRKVGYHTAYKGKWHLSRHFDLPACGESAKKIMNEYGFSDFSSPGDQAAHTLGGFHVDQVIASSAIAWLRKQGLALSGGGTPWCLTVSLVNPHDIMYFNADAVGESAQDNGNLLMQAARAPQAKWYENKWRQALPSNLYQALDEVGRPRAHAEFDQAWGYCLGKIPLKEANWNRFTDFYLNSIRSVDQQLNLILNELDNLGLTSNTIIVFTADHGEQGGQHGLRGKGPFAYREAIHVPFYVVHPDVKGGAQCKSLTSHIDIVPSLLSMAGVSSEQAQDFAGRKLPGKDISLALNNPTRSELHAVREHTLFTYSCISTNDSEMIRLIAQAKAEGKNPKEAIKKSGYKPDLRKRGTVRSVYDGRYKFSRYFSPMQRHSPKSLEELFKYNDIELFDLTVDPNEMKNLALDSQANSKLIMAMSAKLESAIAQEMGVDDGSEMPNFPGIDWSLDSFDL